MRPIILTFVAYYLPGYKSGGPVRTIANMVHHLGDEFDFRIVTMDRDAGDTEPYPDIRVDAWNQVGKAQVFYCSARKRSVRALIDIINDIPYDVLYLNSFFDSMFTIRPLLARRLGQLDKRPVLLAPRGEFSHGAMALQRGKKAAYVGMAKLLRLYNSLFWQASSEYEVDDIRRVMGRTAKEHFIAANVPGIALDLPESAKMHTQRKGPLRIIFLSRISPKKNLDFALSVLMQVKVPVIFSIYGPADEGYWQHCQELIARLPCNVTAVYHGSVDHRDVPKVMAEHDLFFLPTRGENYGHVILEAMSVGTPVVISDTTPWRGLSELGVGWDLPLTDREAFSTRIEDCAAMGVAEYQALRLRTQLYARDRLSDAKTVEANRGMFLSLLNLRGADG